MSKFDEVFEGVITERVSPKAKQAFANKDIQKTLKEIAPLFDEVVMKLLDEDELDPKDIKEYLSEWIQESVDSLIY